MYWVQVGSRLYQRNDLMRQAIELERWPAAELPRLELSMVSATDNGLPCYVAVPAAGEGSSGTLSPTPPTTTTKGGAVERGRVAAGAQLMTAGIPGGRGKGRPPP